MFPVEPGGTGQPPSSPKRALERFDSLLEGGEHVRQALAACVVEVGRELGAGEALPRRGEELADLARVRHPGRVAEGDLLAAEAHEPLGDLEDALGRHLALVGTAEAGRDHALAAHPRVAGGADRFLEPGQRLRDRAVDVLAVVGLRGREEEVHLLEAVAELESVLEPPPVRDQDRVGDTLAPARSASAPRPASASCGITSGRTNEVSSIRLRPGLAEQADQPDLLLGRDHLGLVLEAVAGPNLADPNGLRQRLGHVSQPSSALV